MAALTEADFMCNKTSLLSFLLREGGQRTTGVRNVWFLILYQSNIYLKHPPFLLSLLSVPLFHVRGYLSVSTLLYFSITNQ